MWPSLWVVAALAVLGAALVALILRTRQSAREPAQPDDARKPQGYYLSLGVALGLMFGSALAVALDAGTRGVLPFPTIGPALGLPIGAGIGAALERRHRDELRPLTPREERLQRVATAVALGVSALVVLGVLALIFWR
ncbi:MAG: hypothetical protein ACOX3S_03215 [Anaerolineae bacterium]|jgi:hypothetical protein